MTSFALRLLDRFAHDRPLPDPLPADPMGIVVAWFDEAKAAKHQPNPNVMYLATAAADGSPSVRAVLCKGMDATAASLEFYTNYESRKAGEIEESHKASVLFHWDHADRQVRVEGVVTRCTAEESDRYFASRRWESRLGATASDQSKPIESRLALLDKVAAAVNKLGVDAAVLLAGGNVTIPRPNHWGGYRLWATRVELWQGGTGRIHDRAEWRRDLTVAGTGFHGGIWRSTRLQP